MSAPFRFEDRDALPTGATLRGGIVLTNTFVDITPASGKVICGFRNVGSKNIVIRPANTLPNGQPFSNAWKHSQSVSSSEIPIGDSNGVQQPYVWTGRWTQLSMKSSASAKAVIEIFECDA